MRSIFFFRFPRFNSCIAWAMLAVVVLSGCEKRMHKNTFLAAGTFLEITSSTNDAAGIVQVEIERLEKIFNIFDPRSELSKLNTSGAHIAIPVSSDLYACLAEAKNVYTLSEGAFDITYGALYSRWKALLHNPKTATVPSPEEIARLRAMGGMNEIVLDPDAHTVTKLNDDIRIDASGIADGYMLDSCVRALLAHGISSALINLGGDIFALGVKPDGKPWQVGIRGPAEVSDIVAQETIRDQAITTSGTYEQYTVVEGKPYSHIIDPRTGIPIISPLVSVTVIAKTCIHADAFATAFFVMGVEKIKQFIAAHSHVLRAYVIIKDADGKNKLQVFP